MAGSKQTAPSEDDSPGIVLKDDGSVAIVDANGDEALVVGAGTVTLVLPTVDPEVAGQLWSDGGVVTVSAG
jgi:hypothetical protein